MFNITHFAERIDRTTRIQKLKMHQMIKFTWRKKTLTGKVYDINQNCANVTVGNKKYFIQYFDSQWQGVNEL